jgi:hypothetical protein
VTTMSQSRVVNRTRPSSDGSEKPEYAAVTLDSAHLPSVRSAYA